MSRANLSTACGETWRAPSWLNSAAHDASFRATRCCAERVYVADSCYDFLHCHPDWPAVWLRAKPRVQAAYAALPKPSPLWLRDLPPTPPRAAAWGMRVALHVRLNDVGSRLLPLGYYSRAVAALRRELTAAPPLFRVQTDGRPADVLRLLAKPVPVGLGLEEGRGDVAVDFSHLARNGTANCGSKTAERCRAQRSADPRDAAALALHRLATADVLVMSRSALSYAAAMLSNGTVFFPSCWVEHRRVLPSWRIWPCCADPTEQPRAGRCKGDANDRRRKTTWRLMGSLHY